jgi:hypothetical protein
MKTLTNDDIDVLYKEISAYEKANPGVKYGEDFPLFAQILVGSEAFRNWVLRASETGLLMPLYMRKIVKDNPEVNNDPDKALQLVFEESPFRQTFMKAIYLGYRLGVESTKTENVN